MWGAASGVAPLAAQDAAAGAVPAWPGFATFAWCPVGFETDAAALQALHGLGVRGVALGEAQDPALARRLGFAVWADQLVGKGVLELRAEQFEPLRAAYERDRALTALQRPQCLSDPAVQGALLARAVEALGRLSSVPTAISLGDEISTTRHVNPLDFSFTPAALAEFRAGLRLRYRDVGELNRAWATAFANFDEVEPFTADRVRGRELADRAELPRNLAPWAEHRRFMDDSLARTTRALAGLVRSKCAAPCGYTGLQPPAAYGGTDYARLLPDMDLFEVYDIGGARALAMSFAHPGSRQIATLFPPDRGRAPRSVAAHLADFLAHGMAGAVLWNADLLVARGDGGAKPTAYGAAVAAALAELAPLAPLAGARREWSPLWIVESHPAVQLHWMLDSAADGPSWVRRLSSYEETHSTSLAARHGWVRLCEDLGLQPQFVAADDLRSRLTGAAPLAMVLPMQVALSDAAVAAVAGYVERGGALIADGMVAYYDETLRRRDAPALDAVFGLTPRAVPRLDDLLVREGAPAAAGRLATGAAAVERGVRAEVGERGPGELMVQLEHRHGRGTAYYLNLAVCEYGSVRLDPARVLAARDLRRRVAAVFEPVGLRAAIDVRGAGLPTCIARSMLRTATGRRFLAVRINALERPALLDELAKRGPIAVQVRFPGKVRIQIAGAGWRDGELFELPLDPLAGLFVEMSR